MQDIYQTFEFHRIKELILEHSKTELGKKYVSELSFSNDRNIVVKQLENLKEMMELISRYSPLTIQSSVDALRLIDIAKKTALLTPQDLNYIANDIDTSIKLAAQIHKIEAEFPLISELCSQFTDLSSLNKEIKRVITPSLTVSDNASKELKEIRQKIKQLESALNSRLASISTSYSSYLSDVNMTIREGHFVLPVKTAYKNKVLGIIYDVSDSGNTTFIEPLEIVQINNDIASKKIEENEEVRRILKAITSLVLLQESEILTNNKIIGELDFLSAKATYALNNEMNIATISSEQEIHLIEAKHPLIDKTKVVANDYHLSEDKRIVIISGPNAGGKTVSLKVVGLLTLMNQAGLALPVKEAKLGLFDHIYIDIGDNQSLSDNLSTFSAHMSNIASILDVVKSKDLVLLDELGTGTDPKEGEVLGLGIVKYLESKHPLCLVSSHYSKIKEYAFSSPNIENSSMLFDEEKLLPTYRYKYLTPGKSYGVEVATRYGIKKEVIEEARKELSKEQDNRFENLLSELQSQIDQNERLKDELQKERKSLEIEKKNLENAQKGLKNQKEHLLEEVKKEKEQILEDTKEEIDQIIKSLSSGDLKLHEVIELKKKVEDMEEETPVIIYDEKINVNDYVSVPYLSIEGKVTRIKSNKASLITNDGMNVEIEINKLHKIPAPLEKKVTSKKQNYEANINANVGLELNIIGLHRDEALNALKKYIDLCYLKNFKQVRIIHGLGSGVLRKMTHEYLSTLRGVKYRLGDINEGGSGATVVYFND